MYGSGYGPTWIEIEHGSIWIQIGCGYRSIWIRIDADLENSTKRVTACIMHSWNKFFKPEKISCELVRIYFRTLHFWTCISESISEPCISEPAFPNLFLTLHFWTCISEFISEFISEPCMFEPTFPNLFPNLFLNLAFPNLHFRTYFWTLHFWTCISESCITAPAFPHLYFRTWKVDSKEKGHN